MAKTPLIRNIRNQGGTFYTFPSAAEDLGFSFNSDNKKFRFSNYVLLNLPNIKVPVPDGEGNSIQLGAIPGATVNTDLNLALIESFQNYALNLESMIISSDNYNPDENRTVSERVFFKWLKELGAIRFRQANPNESIRNGQSSDIGIRYVEDYVENYSEEGYNKLVQYIGNIDIVNNVKNKDNAYTEVYIHIPTMHGSQRDILFKTEIDDNYKPGLSFSGGTNINGRENETSTPLGLGINAYYDSNGSFVKLSKNGTPNTYWYSQAKLNTYFLEYTNQDELYKNKNGNDLEGYFSDPRSDKLKNNLKDNSIEYNRTRLDGISIDFNPNNYTYISQNQGINSFGEFAEDNTSADKFDFNAVLVYYELDDENSNIQNLFGILFLDDVTTEGTNGSYIERYTKYKPNSSGQNGNAYSFKLNLKFDINSNDAAVETVINDYNTFSLDLFADALTQLKESARILQNNNKLSYDLKKQIDNLRGLIIDSDNLPSVMAKINNIEKLINDSNYVFINNDNIIKLINRNYNEIMNIYNGETSVEVSYNLDAIKSGNGIRVEKKSNKELNITNTNVGFSLSKNPRISIDNFNADSTNSSYTYTHELQNFSNWIRITDGSIDNPKIIDGDIRILIDDSNFKFNKGQVFRISFSYGLNMSNSNGNFNLLIYSDAEDTLNTGSTYSAEIAIISYDKFINKQNNPVIELICIDPETYDFEVDIF